MSSVFQLVYVSSARVRFTPEELDALLSQARTRNEAAKIGGMLLHDDGNFMQVLEGERDPVLALFERIRRDPRHHRIITLLSHQIAHRDFDEWSMGYRNVGTPQSPRPPGFNEFFEVDLDIPDIAPRALRLLISFRNGVR
jgi:hypothetical protein